MMGKRKDLVVLVADLDMEMAVRGLLSRSQSLGIREINCDVFRHPQRDPGCYTHAHDFLRVYAHSYNFALVLFDYEWSRPPDKNSEDLRSDLERRLAASGWKDRARVIVIHPELEVWVWSDSPFVDEYLGWSGRQPSLRSWLRQNKMLGENEFKPHDPKQAMENALRTVRKPRSASIFGQLAERVSVNRCSDPAFLCFCDTLQQWFSK